MRIRTQHLAVAAVALTALPVGNHLTGHDRRCAAQFDRAQRTDMESYRDFQKDVWRDGHDQDAVSIFASGEALYGIDEIMAAAETHFTRKWAVWGWTEVSRHVDGCSTAVIVYDATYDIPSIGYHQRALTTVAYTYKHGRWLGVLDQGTFLEAPS
jgi:hypothetical protein